MNLLCDFIIFLVPFCPQQRSFWMHLSWLFRVGFAPVSNGMRVSENHPRKTHAFWSKLGSRTPDPKKMWKDTKNTKKWMPEMDPMFNKNLSFSLCFFVGFRISLEGCFFCCLVAKVLQTGTTSGHFCSYITPKLESWKLVFRQDQTLLFLSFEGLGRNIFGSFFQHFFWFGFWVMILRFF